MPTQIVPPSLAHCYRQMLQVVTAALDGQPIEVRPNKAASTDQDWRPAYLPAFNFGESMYRIKPFYRNMTVEELYTYIGGDIECEISGPGGGLITATIIGIGRNAQHNCATALLSINKLAPRLGEKELTDYRTMGVTVGALKEFWRFVGQDRNVGVLVDPNMPAYEDPANPKI